jgi:hypothetical protein
VKTNSNVNHSEGVGEVANGDSTGNTDYTLVRVAQVNSSGDWRYVLSNGVVVDGSKFADDQCTFAKAGQTVHLDGDGVLHIVSAAP